MRFRVNDQIRAPLVHLIDENGNSLGTVSTDQALVLAYEKNLDVVEVSPNANPPVARLVDYGKYIYEQQKKQRKAKSHQKESKLKEIKLSFKIEEHDFKTKVKHALDFFAQGHKVRLFMTLRGREKAYTQDAVAKLFSFAQTANAKFENRPAQLGNTISGILIKNHAKSKDQ